MTPDFLFETFLAGYTKGMISGLRTGLFNALYLFFLFQVKHMVVDFFVQNRFPWMWQNKHKLLHLGGWAHAGSHAAGSFLLFWFASSYTEDWPSVACGLCLTELFVHFFIDYAKMNIGTWRQWGPNTSPHFWDLLGIDQFLHQLTYLYMVGIWLV